MQREAQWVPGNHPIAIDSDTPPSILAAGSLAVFAVDRETGERLHLFSVVCGEPLFPLACPAGARWDIRAVPLETSCLQPAADLRKWEEIFALENWLAKIGEALTRFGEPGSAGGSLGQTQSPEPGRTLNLQPGERVATDSGVTLLHLESGDGRLLGAATSGTAVTAGATLALVPGIGLEAIGEARWKALETGLAPMFTHTIDLLVPLLFAALDQAKLRREAVDRARFDARQEVNRRISVVTLETLADVAGQRTRRGESVRSSGDPLLDAVRAAMAVLGAAASVSPAGVSRRGSDAVAEIARASGLRTRTVLLAGEWWRRDNGPLVTHSQNGHPVALLPCRRGYEILDTADGTRKKLTRASAADLNSFALALYRPLPDDLSARGLLKHILLSRRRDLRTIVVAGAGAALLGMAAPQGIAILIAQAIPDADRRMVWQIGWGLLAAAIGAACFLFTQAVAIFRVQSMAFMTLQTGVWDYLLKLSPAFFRSLTAGQLRLRADAVTRVHQLLSADALRSLFAGVASFLGLAVILWYSPALALIALVCGLAVIACTWLGARALLRVQQEWQEIEEILSGLVLQSINAVSKLRVAGAADRAFAHWAREYSQKQKLSLRVQTLKDRIRLFNLVVPTVSSALAFYYLLRQPIALGPFLACNAALTLFMAAVTSASDSISGLVLAANLWQSLRTILAVKPEVDESKTHPGRLRGAVSVDNLTFRYRSDGPMILDGISIEAGPGECIALTGPSGCGKSTLINLILRFETPHSGAIYLDGRELSGLDITAVRRQIGVVTQDGRIMAGSLFESICGGGANTMDEAWEAARSAGLAEDIEAMPMGMHTVVSEGGGNLSGGQRQRLLIARALMLKPAILIFDEATSALDNRTQAIVTESLNRLKATRILVAHRLSTIRHADRIYVIEKGKVVQQGRFEELAGKPGLFARLVQRQTA
jgi:NHLM bacteriocin system ABC transporter ATP-binding protein